MKSMLLGLFCLISFSAQALDYEPQFENDQIYVAKAKIQPHEEIEPHRDAYPQIVIALKGGTITRLEADGREIDVNFPTGVAVVRGSDPEGELHRSVNNSSEPVELVIIQLKNSPPVIENKPDKSHDIFVNIKINCPESEELQKFVRSIPPVRNHFSSFDEWKVYFLHNMNQLTRLVESEKIFQAWWFVNIDESLSKKNGA